MLNKVPYQALTIDTILNHAETIHGTQPIVSFDSSGEIERSTYKQVAVQTKKLANALTSLGVEQGDCISTFAWNDIRHLECYFAIPCLGAICHTVNPRLHIDQLQHILNDAQSKWLIVDPQFVSIVAPLTDQVPSLKGVILLQDTDEKSLITDQNPDIQVHIYETLISGQSNQINWPLIDENSPSGCCYTSGTTGAPKGVLYSHRSTVLHSMAASMGDVFSITASSNILVVVPMFHVNAWGLPYSAAMNGAKLVLPGKFMGDGAMLSRLIEEENVNIAAGVPTVWQNWLAAMKQQNKSIHHSLKIIIGGSACTADLRSSLEELGCEVRPAWGMTETSPVGCVNPSTDDEHKLCPGKAIYGVEMRIVDDNGDVLPNNGEITGELQVRGPWIARAYIGKDNSSEFSDNGWFRTGDIAKIYPNGCMHIADRAKDIIKSGGEWISSTLLEDVASSHPNVSSAAVIGQPHPKWDERPVLLVVPNDNAPIDKQELLAWYDGKVASWWKPDDIQVIESLPLTATGKIDKKQLRMAYIN